MLSAGIHTQWSGMAHGPAPLLEGATMRFQCPPFFSLKAKVGAQKKRSGSTEGSGNGIAFLLHDHEGDRQRVIYCRKKRAMNRCVISGASDRRRACQIRRQKVTRTQTASPRPKECWVPLVKTKGVLAAFQHVEMH